MIFGFIFNLINQTSSIDNLMMSIGGSEWIIIIFLFLFLIVGSKKLPEFTRLLGRAVGEYQKTRDSFFQDISNSSSFDSNIVSKDTNISTFDKDKKTSDITRDIDSDHVYKIGKSITTPLSTEREKLEKIAISLGITDLNKSDDELRIIINKKMGI